MGCMTAIRWIGFNKHGQSKWLWACDCGRKKVVGPRRSFSNKCRCLHSGKKAKNLARKSFGDWHVIKRSERQSREIYWLCRCRCGVEKEVKGKNLVSRTSTWCPSCAKKKCTVGELRRRERIKAGLTLAAIAELEGISKQAVFLREQSKRESK